MHETRLIHILKTFSESEFKNFGKFISSPYFTTGRDLTPLYKVLKGFYPEFTAKGLEKEKVFSKLGKGKYNEQLMRIIISDLYKMAIEYLKQLSFRSDEIKANFMLMKTLMDKGLLSLAKNTIAETESAIKNSDIGEGYFYNRFQLESERSNYFLHTADVSKKRGTQTGGSEYFLYNFLEISAFELHYFFTQKMIYNKDYINDPLYIMLSNHRLETIEHSLHGTKEKDVARTFLYYILSHTNAGDTEYFYKLKECVIKYLRYFRRPDRKALLVIFESLCIKKSIEIDYDKFTLEILECTTFMLAEGMFKRAKPKYVSPVRFNNLITKGIDAKNADWMEKILNTHIIELAPEHRNPMLEYAGAEIAFLRNDFEKVLNALSKTEVIPFLKPMVYALQLKTYYELGYVEEALSAADAYSHFILNNKQATTATRKMKKDFLKFYRKLLLYKSGKRSNTIQELKTELASISTPQKRWLTDKLNELE